MMLGTPGRETRNWNRLPPPSQFRQHQTPPSVPSLSLGAAQLSPQQEYILAHIGSAFPPTTPSPLSQSRKLRSPPSGPSGSLGAAQVSPLQQYIMTQIDRACPPVTHLQTHPSDDEQHIVPLATVSAGQHLNGNYAGLTNPSCDTFLF